MSKSIILKITGTILAALLLLYLLVSYSIDTTKNNGFLRQWDSRQVPVLQNSLSVERPILPCGASSSCLYFSGKDPRKIIVTDYKLNILDTIFIPLPYNQQMAAAHKVIVDSPFVQHHFGNIGTITQWCMGDTSVLVSKLSTPLFTKSSVFTRNSIVIRGFDSTQSKQQFKKIDLFTGKAVSSIYVFERQTDAGLSSDGMFSYDASGHRILYVQYYANQFICFDSSLNLLYKARTIDTASSNGIQMQTIIREGEGGSLMPSTPLKMTNRASCIYQNHLYVLSSLKADNEARTDFRNNSTVDVYALVDGSYERSFYIPNVNGQKVISFQFYNNFLVASYNGYISVFIME